MDNKVKAATKKDAKGVLAPALAARLCIDSQLCLVNVPLRSSYRDLVILPYPGTVPLITEAPRFATPRAVNSRLGEIA